MPGIRVHHVLGLFKVYTRTLSLPINDLDANRLTVSTDVMKIMMICYQRLSAAANEQMVAYLSVIFDLLD
jgi:hypothetical protein